MTVDHEYTDRIINRLRDGRVAFVHSPAMWKEMQLPVPLQWRSVDFSNNARSSVPNESGVYAFMLEPKSAGPPKSAYLLYIGMTGANRGFRRRYADYLTEKDKDFVRPLLYRMLKRWDGHIRFHYATIADAAMIRRTEEALLNACVPPYNQQFTGRKGRSIQIFKKETTG